MAPVAGKKPKKMHDLRKKLLLNKSWLVRLKPNISNFACKNGQNTRFQALVAPRLLNFEYGQSKRTVCMSVPEIGL